MYEQELKSLGMTDNEAKLYIALLEKGIQNPTKLAETTGLHRSYVYDTVERLIERGIVNTVLINNKKSYQAVDPKALRESFELQLKQIDTILPNLQTLFNEATEETRIELHRGKRVYKTLIKDLLANVQANDIVYFLGIDENILETVEPIYLKQYFNIIKDKNVREKVIIKTGGKKLTEENIEYKELDEKYLGETTLAMYGNKVFMFIWGNPHYLITIDSKRVAQSYKKQFEALWEMAS